MNKKFLKVTFVAAITLVSGINVFNSHKTEMLSDVVLANVEALANPEIFIGVPCAEVINSVCLYLDTSGNDHLVFPGTMYV